MIDRLLSIARPFQFKGKARLLDRLVPRTGRREAVVFGYRMKLDLAEHIQRSIYMGVYERWETRAVRRHLQPGMTVVDVGANVGYFTLLAAQLVGPTGRVIAVEPSGPAADRLAATIGTNGIGNVVLERCGLGRALGEAVLYEPDPSNHTPTMLGTPGEAGHVVPIRTLEDLSNSHAIDQVDLMKIDVEGFELEVFAGSEQLFASGRIRAVLCEFNEFWLTRGGTTGEAVYRQLLAHGFEDRSRRPYVSGTDLANRFFVLPHGR